MKQQFFAEIKQVKASKTASNDMENVLTVVTDEKQILDLGKYPARTLFKITIEDVPEKEKAPSYRFT